MPGQSHRVEVESIYWPTAAPSLNLFQTFRQAIHPSKLSLAFILVLLLYLGGLGLNAVSDGVSAMAAPRFAHDPARLAMTPFAWLNGSHPWIVFIYSLYAFALVALFGGAISRLAAMHACRDIRRSSAYAMRFASRRYIWFILGPVIPLLLVVGVALLQAALGLAFFNLPITDVIGGVLFPILLLGGLINTLVLIGLIAGVHVIYPAICVEGADAFDALSRTYNYVLGRPWRFLGYMAASLIYFAVTYVFLGLIIYGTVWCTHRAVGIGAFTTLPGGVERFEAIMSAGMIGSLGDFGSGALSATPDIAGGFVAMWIRLLTLVLPAYAVSFYFCACTWIYLLLRRDADGVELDDVYLDDVSEKDVSHEVHEGREAA